MPRLAPKISVFLAVPFRRTASPLSQAVETISGEYGLEFNEIRNVAGSAGTVREAIQSALERADLIIADITGGNPNVLWEIGYAEALKKPIVLAAEDTEQVPFDLRLHRVILYTASSSPQHIASRLSAAIYLAVEGAQAEPRSLAPTKKRDKVFISYSHRDSEYLDRILVHLRPLERAGVIDQWSDTKLRAGDRWKEQIRSALAATRVAILLISADFLASDFVVTNELPPLLTAAEHEGARIIPVIVKPSRFLREPELAKFQALNDPLRPLIRLSEVDREELYAKLADQIEIEST